MLNNVIFKFSLYVSEEKANVSCMQITNGGLPYAICLQCKLLILEISKYAIKILRIWYFTLIGVSGHGLWWLNSTLKMFAPKGLGLK